MDFAGDTLDNHDHCGLAVPKSQLEKEPPAPHFFINKESIRYKILLRQRIIVQHDGQRLHPEEPITYYNM